LAPIMTVKITFTFPIDRHGSGGPVHACCGVRRDDEPLCIKDVSHRKVIAGAGILSRADQMLALSRYDDG